MNFNWADIFPELVLISEFYEPKVGMAGGVPDYLPPEPVLNALEIVAQNQFEQYSYMTHQYTRGKGHPRLVSIIAQFYSYLLNRKLNAGKEILVTVGASHALDLVTRAFLDPGDEVIVFEPFYVDYRLYVTIASARLVTVPLKMRDENIDKTSNDWTFDKFDFESRITRRTKMILLNNPNNPIGKSFTIEELAYIGLMAEEYNLVIVSDEAGQWYNYEIPDHIRIASIPWLFKRTVTINSGGKMFSNTGWRIGWVIAPEDMLWAMAAISQSNIVSAPTPLQIAYAIALETELKEWGKPESWLFQLKQFATKARNLIIYYLVSVGADVIIPTAGYSIVANFTQLADQIDLSSYEDCRPGMRFAEFLAEKGLEVLPISIFYGPENMWKTEYTIRVTNMKTENTIHEFGALLTSIFQPLIKTEDSFGENTTVNVGNADPDDLFSLSLFGPNKKNAKLSTNTTDAKS